MKQEKRRRHRTELKSQARVHKASHSTTRKKQGNRKKYTEKRGEFPSQHRQHLIHSYWGNNGLEMNRPISRDFPHLFSSLVTDSSLSAQEE